MGEWTINRGSVILLLGVLTVIVLVLVLPQVDLLDTAFQRGTAPIVIHAQGTERPAFQILSLLLIFFLFKTGLADQRSENRLLIMSTHAVRILNHCLRC
jgi:hypothetical protein